MLKNKIYLFDKWLSKDQRSFNVLGLVFISVLLISFESTLFYGMGLMLLICSYVVFIKAKIIGGQWELDKKLYQVPEEGEVLVIRKDFYWDGSLKSYYVPNGKPNTLYIEKGTEFDIISIEELEDDWVIKLVFQNNIMLLSYFEFKSYFKTKSQLRDEKLKKILK
jgi:hypothetical protein